MSEELVEINGKTLLDDYLNQVEKNLKGFSREAKDSILIEIREHILDRVEEEQNEEGGKGEGGQSVREIGSIVKKILMEFGEPKIVADNYSPIVRLKEWKPNLFLIVSCIVSLYLLISISDGLKDFMEEYETNEYVYVYFWIAFLAVSNLGFNLAYLKYSDSMSKYSSVIILLNFLQFLTFGILVPLQKFDMIEFDPFSHPPYSDIWAAEVIVNILYGALFVSFILYLSSLGYKYVSSDIADGIAPKLNISVVLLPLLLVPSIALTAHLGHSLVNSLDLYLVRFRLVTMAFFVLGLAISISITLILIMRYRYSFRFFVVRKQVFAVSVLFLLVISAMCGASLTSGIDEPRDITKDEKQRPWGEIVEYNGKLYSWTVWITAMENGEWGREFSLFSWMESKLILNHAMNMKENHAWFSDSRMNVKISGEYIHVHFPLMNSSSEGEFLVGHYYLLLTFQGNVIAENSWFLNHTIQLNRPNIFTRYPDWKETTMVVNGSRSAILASEWIPSGPEMNERKDLIIWGTDIENGTVISEAHRLVDLPVESFLSDWNLSGDYINSTLADMGVMLFNGIDSFSYIFYFSPVSIMVDTGSNETIDLQDYELFFYEKRSLAGEIQIPFTLVVNASLPGDSYGYTDSIDIWPDRWILPPQENDTYFTPVFAQGNTIYAFIETFSNETLSLESFQSFTVSENGSVDQSFPHKVTFDWYRDRDSGWAFPGEERPPINSWPGFDTINHFDIFRSSESVPLAYFEPTYWHDENGTLLLISQDSNLKLTADLIPDPFSIGLSGQMWHAGIIQSIVKSGNSTLIIGRFTHDEYVIGIDRDYEFDYSYIITINETGESIEFFGPVFETQRESSLYIAIFSGIFTGFLIPSWLWSLLKKRGKGVE